MPFMNDFETAIQSYPADSVTLSITNVAVHTGTPGPLNVDEIVKFRVKVENTGAINMTNVQLHVTGLNDTTISTTGPAGPFLSGYQVFDSFTVNAGGSQKSAELYFKAPPTPQGAGTDLVTAHIYDWHADLDYLLENSSSHTVGSLAIYAAEVFP